MPTPKVPGLDLDRLLPWLAARTPIDSIDHAEVIAGGRSNLTYLLDTNDGPLILRRPPFGSVLPGAHDVVREHRIVESLFGTGVPVAEPIGACEDPKVIGAPFGVTRFVPGATLRAPEDVAVLQPGAAQEVVDGFGRTLARLHRVDPTISGLPAERGAGHVARQLRVWTRQLKAPPVRPLPMMDRLSAALGASQPEQQRTSLVHGDYRLDNVRLGPEGEVRAVLDWELWSLGDPLVDLGVALVYWLEEPWELAPLGSSPTFSPHLGNRSQLLAAYQADAGIELEPSRLWWYAAFGTWRFASILEGVYRRHLEGAYDDGGEDDTDWRRFEYVVPALADQAGELLRRGGWSVPRV